MKNNKVIDTLLAEAPVPIRWRTDRKVLGRTKPQAINHKELLKLPKVHTDLDLLTGDCRFNSLHSY